ncbi:MAG: helix-turn-helix transcriptional regulator [Prevotella sp.]|nr:helix-turn-helix transcriptional regulator [Prevotella sp.]
MDTLEYTSPQFILFCMLYGGAAVAAVVLCFYLLFRRGNAIAADITPPIRLRRWAAAFFAVGALGHLWWFLLYVFAGDSISWGYIVCVVLDCVLMLTTVSGILLSMLQDRKRPVWPFAAAMTPVVVLGVLQIVRPDINFLNPALLYTLALYIIFTIYMVMAVRQYGQWLRDNYADLEHKEVWQSHTLLILFLLLVTIYGFASDGPSLFLLRIADFVLFGLVLWRVETLPQLEAVSKPEEDSLPASKASEEPDLLSQKAQADPAVIRQLLAEHCIDNRLYLQHDLTLAQLSSIVGINRTYLSRYFSSQGISYNTYINNLRINHFVSLYQEAVASQQSFTLQQLASDSGYQSYSTFSNAFKQSMGQSVRAWIRETEG